MINDPSSFPNNSPTLPPAAIPAAAAKAVVAAIAATPTSDVEEMKMIGGEAIEDGGAESRPSSITGGATAGWL